MGLEPTGVIRRGPTTYGGFASTVALTAAWPCRSLVRRFGSALVGGRGRRSSSLDRPGFLVTRTRRERRPERNAAQASLAGAVVASAVAVAILRYGSGLDESAADLVYLGDAAWSLARWLTARRQERMLRDPRRAVLVPPRAEHLAGLRGNTGAGFAALGGLVFGVGLIAAGFGYAKAGEDDAALPRATEPGRPG